MEEKERRNNSVLNIITNILLKLTTNVKNNQEQIKKNENEINGISSTKESLNNSILVYDNAYKYCAEVYYSEPYGYRGSGFVYKYNKEIWLLTAAHCVLPSNISSINDNHSFINPYQKKNTVISVCLFNKKENRYKSYFCILYGVDATADIAILQIRKLIEPLPEENNENTKFDYSEPLLIDDLSDNVEDYTGLQLRDSNNVKNGEHVYTIGYPLAVDSFSISNGLVRDSKFIGSPTESIFHSIDTVGGNSGGPILDINGMVIGMNNWGYSGEQLSGGISSFMIKPIFEKIMNQIKINDSPIINKTFWFAQSGVYLENWNMHSYYASDYYNKKTYDIIRGNKSINGDYYYGGYLLFFGFSGIHRNIDGTFDQGQKGNNGYASDFDIILSITYKPNNDKNTNGEIIDPNWLGENIPVTLKISRYNGVGLANSSWFITSKNVNTLKMLVLKKNGTTTNVTDFSYQERYDIYDYPQNNIYNHTYNKKTENKFYQRIVKDEHFQKLNENMQNKTLKNMSFH